MNWLLHHLPRTGGTGVRFWVGHGLGDRPGGGMVEFGPKGRSGTLPEDTYRGLATLRSALCTSPRAIMGHYVGFNAAKLFGWNPDTVINATIIRDPAERLVSQWAAFRTKQPDTMCSFEEWIGRDERAVTAGKAMPRICYCLECQFDGLRHCAEPMNHFYASRKKEDIWRGLGTAAEGVLRGMRVYTMGEIPILVQELAGSLGLNPADYRPEHVSGFGAQASEEQRRLVEKNHPMDAELYAWARNRKKKRKPLEAAR